MATIIGILLLCGLGYYLCAKSYQSGLKKNGHVCSNAPITQGVRYTPQIMKQVNLPCRECGEVIPSEFRVITDSRTKKIDFRPELDMTDFHLHMEIYHDKVGENSE